MRYSYLVALLPALAAAQEQVPLMDRVQGWFNKAKSSIMPDAQMPAAAPVEQVAVKKVLSTNVQRFNLENWQDLLQPTADSQNWLVYVTGGNKTCFGHCDRADDAFNKSTKLFATDSSAPKLGYLDCETETVLCNAWIANTPSVWYFQLPVAQAGEERPSTPLHIVNLNMTSVTADDIYKVHSDNSYKENSGYVYQGAFHPLDGWIARYGLLVPIGRFVAFINTIPSWTFVVLVSFLSRTFMGQRAARTRPGAPAPGR